MKQKGKDKNKDKDKDEDEGFVVYSYDPPLPEGASKESQEEVVKKYQNDPSFRKVLDEVFGKHWH